MIKFFNVILVNLILIGGYYYSEALILRPLSLKDEHFNVEESQDLLEFDRNNLKDSLEKENSKAFDSSQYFDGTSLPSLDSSNDMSQELQCPLHNQKDYPLLKWNDNWYKNCINEVASRWKNFHERRRKKRVSRRQMSSNELPTSILDYTNSQMPFNEGRLRPTNSPNTLKEFTDGFWEDREKYSFFDPKIESVAKPNRFERSVMKRRFEVPVKSQEYFFETPRDDPLLGYSRVRRFLDHERAKIRKRMPGTLEAKEAAMSRILDPNLNLDGILEPHVRKRRGQHSKKRDLSLKMFKKN